MPIRLNLLAEAQAAEEARRRDPVKRAVWGAALFLVLILVWSSSLQLKAMLIRSDLTRLEGKVSAHDDEYQLVLENQNKTVEINRRLQALQQLATERFLNGTLLNALQHTTVDEVQLLRLHLEQSYVAFEGTKARTNQDNVLVPGKPATATEKTLLVLEGADTAANPGDGLNRYREGLATSAYFRQSLVKTNGIGLKSLAPPQISPINGKRSVIFTLECRYPEKTR